MVSSYLLRTRMIRYMLNRRSPEEKTVIVSDFLNDDNKFNKNLAKQSL